MARFRLTGGPVPVLYLRDTTSGAWEYIPVPDGLALIGTRMLWGMDGSPYKHAVPPPAAEHGPRLPSAALLRTPAFHHTPPPNVSDQLCSVHAVWATLVWDLTGQVGTGTFSTSGDVPGAVDLLTKPVHELNFARATPPPKTACNTAAELGRRGMQRPGMPACEP